MREHCALQGGSEAYVNPALLGAVTVESGKMCYGDIQNLVGREGTDVWTDDDPAETW